MEMVQLSLDDLSLELCSSDNGWSHDSPSADENCEKLLKALEIVIKQTLNAFWQTIISKVKNKF